MRVSVAGLTVLVPERAQSCLAVVAAVVMAMCVMKDADHEATRLPEGANGRK